jgi:hypothetical protein
MLSNKNLMNLKNRDIAKDRIAPDYFRINDLQRAVDHLSGSCETVIDTPDGGIYIFSDGTSAEIEGRCLSVNTKIETDQLLTRIGHEQFR